MNVNVSVSLLPGDTWTMTPTEAAEAILVALNGDEKIDIVNVGVSGSGSAGNVPQVAPPSPVGMVPSVMPPPSV